MTKTGSNKRWLRDHRVDPYVKLAQQRGFRSRAAFKLLEIDERDRLLRPGMTVADLGAAPGSWSQVAAARVGDSGRVVAVDILEMDPLPHVEVIQGDFREQAVLELVLRAFEGRPADLVLSDMSPNISGMKAIDQPRAMYLAELAMDFACRVLAPQGSLLLKLFQGEGFDAFRAEAKRSFAHVSIRKPKASKSGSRETYLLARRFGV